jgi:hypothetical protein
MMMRSPTQEREQRREPKNDMSQSTRRTWRSTEASDDEYTTERLIIYGALALGVAARELSCRCRARALVATISTKQIGKNKRPIRPIAVVLFVAMRRTVAIRIGGVIVILDVIVRVDVAIVVLSSIVALIALITNLIIVNVCAIIVTVNVVNATVNTVAVRHSH